jgi:hypothetical protein
MVISAFKRNDMNTRVIITRPNIEESIGRTLVAWHTSASIEFISDGWKAGRLQVCGPLSEDAVPEVDPRKIGQLVHVNYPDAAAIIDDCKEEE